MDATFNATTSTGPVSAGAGRRSARLPARS